MVGLHAEIRTRGLPNTRQDNHMMPLSAPWEWGDTLHAEASSLF